MRSIHKMQTKPENLFVPERRLMWMAGDFGQVAKHIETVAEDFIARLALKPGVMGKYDFKIIATWETKKGDRTEFVYLLEWPDKKTIKDRWAKFMADQEWANIKKETSGIHGQLVGKIEDRSLELMDYSPRKTLAR